MKRPLALSIAACLAAASAAHAQSAAGTMEHSGMNHGAMATGEPAAPSSKAFMEAMKGMSEGMDATLTGDADLDFLQGMIPHHQGAIDMAKVELRYGKDPKVRALAEAIIKAQEAEIGEMKRWIAERK